MGEEGYGGWNLRECERNDRRRGRSTGYPNRNLADGSGSWRSAVDVPLGRRTSVHACGTPSTGRLHLPSSTCAARRDMTQPFLPLLFSLPPRLPRRKRETNAKEGRRETAVKRPLQHWIKAPPNAHPQTRWIEAGACEMSAQGQATRRRSCRLLRCGSLSVSRRGRRVGFGGIPTDVCGFGVVASLLILVRGPPDLVY